MEEVIRMIFQMIDISKTFRTVPEKDETDFEMCFTIASDLI